MAVAQVRLGDIEHALQTAQREVGDEALGKPGDRTEWAYGYACGLYGGIGLAWQTIKQIYEDAERSDREM